MPDTRPGITFNEDGVCNPCLVYEKKKNTDWNVRFIELEELCKKYRKEDKSYYDCIIAVSGGKDSHVQVHWMKEIMKMNFSLYSYAIKELF
jgi:tRNA(Ile)-lysidine synthase TilS/MesJ